MLLEKDEKGAAGAIAEHGNADHHVGEVVPLDDREKTQEENLVGQGAC